MTEQKSAWENWDGIEGAQKNREPREFLWLIDGEVEQGLGFPLTPPRSSPKMQNTPTEFEEFCRGASLTSVFGDLVISENDPIFPNVSIDMIDCELSGPDDPPGPKIVEKTPILDIWEGYGPTPLSMDFDFELSCDFPSFGMSGQVFAQDFSQDSGGSESPLVCLILPPRGLDVPVGGDGDMGPPEKSLDLRFTEEFSFSKDFFFTGLANSRNEREKPPISLLDDTDFGDFLSFFQKMWPRDSEKSQKSGWEAPKNKEVGAQKNLTEIPSEAESGAGREKEKKDVETHFSSPKTGFQKELSKRPPSTPGILSSPSTSSTHKEVEKRGTKETSKTQGYAPTLAESDPGQKGAQKVLEKEGVSGPPMYPRRAKSPEPNPLPGVGFYSDGGRPCTEVAGAWKGPQKETKNPMGTLIGDLLPPPIEEKHALRTPHPPTFSEVRGIGDPRIRTGAELRKMPSRPKNHREVQAPTALDPSGAGVELKVVCRTRPRALEPRPRPARRGSRGCFAFGNSKDPTDTECEKTDVTTGISPDQQSYHVARRGSRRKAAFGSIVDPTEFVYEKNGATFEAIPGRPSDCIFRYEGKKTVDLVALQIFPKLDKTKVWVVFMLHMVFHRFC